MATTVYKGTGAITSADFKTIEWVGKDKAGNAVKIELTDALMTSNISFDMLEKNDSVPELVFEACYTNTDSMSESTAEPWSITTDSGTSAGAGEILLGAGKVKINGTDIALTRGGSSFNVEREIREINADGDRGMVKGRVVIESSRAKLTVRTLTFLKNITSVFPAVAASV